MKLRNTAIALGVGAATAAGLTLLKVNKEVVIGSTAAVTGAVLLYKENKKQKKDKILESFKLNKQPISKSYRGIRETTYRKTITH